MKLGMKAGSSLPYSPLALRINAAFVKATGTVPSLRRWESSFKGTFKNIKIHNPSAAWLGHEKGLRTEEAGKKPVRLQLEAGKKYSFCTCGLSGIQPWCDGTEKHHGFSLQRPIEFEVDQSGDYWMCMCKTSKTQPLCDGSHKFISQVPNDHDAELVFAVTDDPEVYDGVAKKLGYKTQGGGFQRGG